MKNSRKANVSLSYWSQIAAMSKSIVKINTKLNRFSRMHRNMALRILAILPMKMMEEQGCLSNGSPQLRRIHGDKRGIHINELVDERCLNPV